MRSFPPRQGECVAGLKEEEHVAGAGVSRFVLVFLFYLIGGI